MPTQLGSRIPLASLIQTLAVAEYRLNPESEWIRSEAPELRIVPQELWDAAKARQDTLTALYRKQIEASRSPRIHQKEESLHDDGLPGLRRAEGASAPQAGQARQ